MPDETTPALTYRSKAETLAKIKAAIEDLEVLASLLDEANGNTVVPTPTLTTLTQTVADLADALAPAAPETVSLAEATPPPDTLEPEAKEPETKELETKELETKELETKELETIDATARLSDLELSESELSQPQPSESELSESELSEPEFSGPTSVANEAGATVAASPEAAPDSAKADDGQEASQTPAPPTPERPERPGQPSRFWAGVLQKIRALLPTGLAKQLSDQALTALLSGVVVFTLAIVLLSGSGSEPEPEAIAPPQAETPFAPPTPIFPSEPPIPAPTPIETLAPRPNRPQRLTPEQKLIASIQDQVAQITDQYAEGLIQSIQVDFLAGRLRVLMGSGWYDLERDRQDQVAAEVLERAQRLDFTKVEMIDADDILLARNAVVGDKMLIFEREQRATEANPPVE